uniref:Uncharacterized protein n=1 Tax=Oryza meridionalis TaxID=40149 RepID=A0A0E0EK93_9ORYZ
MRAAWISAVLSDWPTPSLPHSSPANHLPGRQPPPWRCNIPGGLLPYWPPPCSAASSLAPSLSSASPPDALLPGRPPPCSAPFSPAGNSRRFFEQTVTKREKMTRL